MKSIRQLVRSAAAFVALLSVAPPAVAQVTETGTIEVLVQDQGGLRFPARPCRHRG